jgi:hypothetical protein
MDRNVAVRDLEWEKLRRLQGGPRRNWEILCREVVRRHYQRFGPLLTRKQQPGVEFHLELERECELGEPGRHWGWQCKWFEPESFDTHGRLRSGQRAKIEDAIDKSAFRAVSPILRSPRARVKRGAWPRSAWSSCKERSTKPERFSSSRAAICRSASGASADPSEPIPARVSSSS